MKKKLEYYESAWNSNDGLLEWKCLCDENLDMTYLEKIQSTEQIVFFV